MIMIFRTVSAIWQSLGKDPMCSQIVDTLLEFITLTPLYDTTSKQFLNKPVASLIPIAVSNLLVCYLNYNMYLIYNLIYFTHSINNL